MPRKPITPDRGIDPGFTPGGSLPSGSSRWPKDRKGQIKKAILRKPKYGGPRGGRPQAPKRVGKARAASNGIKYL